MRRPILLVDDNEDSTAAEELLKRQQVDHDLVNLRTTRHVRYTQFPVFFTALETFVGLKDVKHAINTHRYL